MPSEKRRKTLWIYDLAAFFFLVGGMIDMTEALFNGPPYESIQGVIAVGFAGTWLLIVDAVKKLEVDDAE